MSGRPVGPDLRDKRHAVRLSGMPIYESAYDRCYREEMEKEGAVVQFAEEDCKKLHGTAGGKSRKSRRGKSKRSKSKRGKTRRNKRRSSRRRR